jgi:hypothetical protein
VSTSLVAFISGFLLGIYSIRGYLIAPALSEERLRNFKDPVESEESDVDENDTILDHAPNWSNTEDADRRQGLRASAVAEGSHGGKKESERAKPALPESNEECKLVLVVRTDLGMTKGKHARQSCPASAQTNVIHPPQQARLPRNVDTQRSHATRPCCAPRNVTLSRPKRAYSLDGNGKDRPKSRCRSSRRTR